jgi:hypothetical protein
MLTLILALAFGTALETQSVVPGAPQSLSGTASGSTVTLNWIPPTTGGVPAGYLVEAALTPSGAVIASITVPANSLTVPNVPNGTYFVRVRAGNAAGLSAPSNEIAITVGSPVCVGPPAAPQGLAAAVVAQAVTLSWAAGPGGCPAGSFVILAGSAPSLSNLAVLDVGGQRQFSVNAPFGTYYVRVVAANSFGASAPSNESVVTVSPGCVAPGRPNAPSASASGTTVNISWLAPTSGGAPTQYRVQAGSAMGLSDRLNVVVTAMAYSWSGAPNGDSYVRVTAINACGTGTPSLDTVVTVGDCSRRPRGECDIASQTPFR